MKDEAAEDVEDQRWKRLQKVDIERELQAMMGDGVRFRGQQKAIIQAVMRGEARVLAIMPTGGGKSLIFMLPAFCSVGGVGVVVVPLIALRQDMI